MQVRAEILAKTGCTASAGIGSNLLLARLATKAAKPNGQLHIHRHEVSTGSALPLHTKRAAGVALT